MEAEQTRIARIVADRVGITRNGRTIDLATGAPVVLKVGAAVDAAEDPVVDNRARVGVGIRRIDPATTGPIRGVSAAVYRASANPAG